jgi:recombination protein RecA
MAGAKNSAADAVLAAMRKGHGAESAVYLNDPTVRSTVRHVYPFGVETIDGAVLGIGGMPGGRIVELYGEEGSFKSTLAALACAQTQADGGVVLYVDMEQTFNEERARVVCGCNTSQFIMVQSDTLEDMFSELETGLNALRGDVPCLVVWDTVAATMTGRQADQGLGGEGAKMNEQLAFAKTMSERLRVLVAVLARTGALMLALNQTRTAPGVSFGDPTTTPGGKAIKFYSSQRIRILGGAKARDKGDEGAIVGKEITVEAIKNKLYPPFRKARVRMLFGAPGVDQAWSTLGYAKDENLVASTLKGPTAHAQALTAMVERGDMFTMRRPRHFTPYVPAVKGAKAGE